MNEQNKTTAMSLNSVTMLRDGLTQLALSLARMRDGDESAEAELYRRLPVVRRVLARFEQELMTQGERSELTALLNVSQAIGSSLDLTQVLNRVMDQIILLTGAERAILMLTNPDTDELEFQVGRNVDRQTIEGSSFGISRSIVNQVASTGDPIVTTNAQMDPRFKSQESVVDYNLRSILCVPFRVRGRISGVIYADNRIRTGLFSDRDRDLLATFASQAAISIENARLFEGVASAKSLRDNIFASIASGVITTDDQDRITLFNRAAEQILQTSEASVIGRSLADAVPTLEAKLRALLVEVRARGEPVAEFETDLLPPDRGTLDLRVSLSPLKDGSNELQGVAVVLDDLTEQRRLEVRDQLFQRYLSPAVIDRLPDDPEQLRLGGVRQEITSMFADIRGFSDFSHLHDPETLVEILNRYLSASAEAVLEQEGTLDKFQGDSVVAFFNAPLPQEDHVLRALRAALNIAERVAYVHSQMPEDCHLAYGVGINVGEAVVGNVGTQRRLDYTAIGVTVNLARRLQEAAAPGQILISQQVFERVQPYIQARPVPSVAVEGMDPSEMPYELLGLED